MAIPNNLENLIRYIAFEVQDRGDLILRTRLVKLLYLVDVENYRQFRELITNLTWVRYLYGPFSFDLQEKTRKMGVYFGEEELDFTSGKGLKIFVEEPPDPERWLKSSQKAFLDRIIKRWGDEDLNVLLDYVYCDTEPMIGAQFMEKLDFGKIPIKSKRSSSPKLKLGKSKIEEIQKKIDVHGHISRPPKSINKSNLIRTVDEPLSPSSLQGKIKFENNKNTKPMKGRE